MLYALATLMTESPALFTGTIFILSLAVGSFLNVVIYRLPIMLDREWRAQAADVLTEASEDPSIAIAAAASPAMPAPAVFTLSTPRSACPKCQAPIRPWQNIPVLSWLMLKGRCAACANPISPRYPIVELTTAGASAFVAWHFGFGAAAASGILLTWSLIALTGIDIDHQLLPDNITLPLMWAGLLAAVIFGATPGQPLPVSPRDAVIGAAAGYLSLWAVFHAFRLITGKEGMGYGDFKLFAALGAWMGWKLLPLIILLSAATGAVLGIAMIVFQGRDKATPMPFGPYLAAAGWLAMLYGDSLVTSYLRLSGLQH